MSNVIRTELESRLLALANSYSPKLPVALEGVKFNKPDPPSPFLECFMAASSTTNVTTDGNRIRQRGVFMVNVWCPDGKGSGLNERIADAVIAAFPVVPKTGSTSIEQTPDASQAVIDVSGWRITPVTITYRYESSVLN